MSEQQFPLSTVPETLLALPIQEALAESERAECHHYGEVFYSKAEHCEDTESANAWRLLGQMCRAMLRTSNPDEPFHPLCVMPEGRSLLPSDLDDVSAHALRQLAEKAEDAELKARLFDIVWVRLRDAQAARQAVAAYIDAAKNLFDPQKWAGYVQRVERATRLAKQIGDKKLIAQVLQDVEHQVFELDGTYPSDMMARLMQLLHEFKKGDLETLNAIATKAAQLAEQQQHFDRARAHYENVSRGCRRSDDKYGERNAKVAIAASYASQADLCDAPGGEIAAAHYLEQAHEAYRHLGMRRETEETYDRLRDAQRHLRESMEVITGEEIDVSSAVTDARQHVAGKPLREALLALATVTSPTDFKRETANAEARMKAFPLQAIMGGPIVAEDGRVITHRSSAATLDEKQAEQALWQRVVEGAMEGYRWDVQARIIPALNQINFDHSFSFQDLHDVVVNNPIIPRGHETLFAKALFAGLRCNFDEAISILVPQFENALRHMLANAGAEVTKRDKHGLQQVIQIGDILSGREEHLRKLLDDDLIKGLKDPFRGSTWPRHSKPNCPWFDERA